MGDRMSQKGLRGSWSKYGDSRKAVIQSHVGKVWSCQSCGERTTDAIEPYLFEFIKGEYIRICAVCMHNGCTILFHRRTLTIT